MSKAKEKYIAFIRDNYVPIFFDNEYLDAVCDGHWDVVLYEEGGEITAAYVYMIKKKFFLEYIIQPQLCPYTGPIFFNTSDTQKAYSYLLSNLPRHHLLVQDYYFGNPILEGFEHTKAKKYTYLIDKSIRIDELWKQQSSNHRRVIRKAEKELKYEEEKSLDVFLGFMASSFKSREKKDPYDSSIFRKVDKVLQSKGLRKIVKCTDSSNVIVAMCYFVRDKHWTYNIANSVLTEYKHYGMNLILWKEIELSISKSRSFDFEGSVIPGIEIFFKRFKGIKTHYQSRYKSTNKIVDLLVKLKTTINNG